MSKAIFSLKLVYFPLHVDNTLPHGTVIKFEARGVNIISSVKQLFEMVYLIIQEPSRIK